MLEWLRIKLKTMFKGKRDDFKKDAQGRSIPNRYGVDDQVNEPDDANVPPLRFPDNPPVR